MNRKLLTGIFLLFASAAAFLSGCVSAPESNTLSQVSTIDALLAGVYDGEVTLAELVTMGDTGIGTFSSLDGEMIVLGGEVYQVKSDGRVYTPSIDTTTPFASVINFRPERRFLFKQNVDYPTLKKVLDQIAPEKNLFYAFKLEGKFTRMKTRSVPRQKKPFPPLAEVVKTQPVFNMENVSGTIVGFRCPAFVKGVNVGGYHLHFISDDRKRGGHILEFEMLKGASVEIDCTNKFFMVLPIAGSGFKRADLNIDRSRELNKVER